MPKDKFVSVTEESVLSHLISGAKPKEAAARMEISIYTLRAHVMNLRSKFGAASISELLQRSKIPRQTLLLEYEARRRADVPTPETLVIRQEQARELDLHFYRSLAAEVPGTACMKGGCARGTTPYSVFCRKHHYEMIKNQPCPFSSDA